MPSKKPSRPDPSKTPQAQAAKKVLDAASKGLLSGNRTAEFCERYLHYMGGMDTIAQELATLTKEGNLKTNQKLTVHLAFLKALAQADELNARKGAAPEMTQDDLLALTPHLAHLLHGLSVPPPEDEERADGAADNGAEPGDNPVAHGQVGAGDDTQVDDRQSAGDSDAPRTPEAGPEDNQGAR